MSVSILNGDCRDVLRTLPDESVHCVVTSPPYWGLRDYGVAGQIGLEESFWDFLDTMVSLFREVRRVLRSDGTAWVNMGDCYANDGKWGGATGGKHADFLHGQASRVGRERRKTGLKPKDLVGQPWRLAFALQDDGWWLRQDVIWHKPNPMPESIEDRCTKAHEYIFLLSKSARYYFDAEAIAEPASDNTHARVPGNKTHRGQAAYDAGDPRHRTKVGLVAYAERQRAGVTPKSAPEGSLIRAKESFHASTTEVLATRNKRSVWTVQTAPFPEAHFATFPPALIEPCILAGSPRGGGSPRPFRRCRNDRSCRRSPSAVRHPHRAQSAILRHRRAPPARGRAVVSECGGVT